jgi:hypothetical protein
MTTCTGNEKTDLRETHRNWQEGPNGNQDTIDRRTGGAANHRETSGFQRKEGTLAYILKLPHHALSSQKGLTLP